MLSDLSSGARRRAAKGRKSLAPPTPSPTIHLDGTFCLCLLIVFHTFFKCLCRFPINIIDAHFCITFFPCSFFHFLLHVKCICV